MNVKAVVGTVNEEKALVVKVCVGRYIMVSDTDSKTSRKFVSGSNHDNLIGALLQIPDRRECDGAASRG